MKLPDINHPSLGLLKFNDEHDWYEGKLTVRGILIDIVIYLDEDSKIEPVLSKIDCYADRLENYAESAKDYAVKGLLEIKNDTWLDIDNGEIPLTPEQFKACMLLESIIFADDGSASFYHKDGDLFWGHCIVVEMDSSNNFQSAEIAG
jgi:hypothetical protein